MAKKLQPNERDFQNWFKTNWSGWLTQLHPGQGSDIGIPDLLVGLPQGICPVEVKIASIEENTLWSCTIRPAQIQWHTKLANHGFNSIMIFGVWSGDHWRVFAADAMLARFWDSVGFSVGETCFEIDTNNLYDSLTDFVFRQLEQ